MLKRQTKLWEFVQNEKGIMIKLVGLTKVIKDTKYYDTMYRYDSKVFSFDLHPQTPYLNNKTNMKIQK